MRTGCSAVVVESGCVHHDAASLLCGAQASYPRVPHSRVSEGRSRSL